MNPVVSSDVSNEIDSTFHQNCAFTCSGSSFFFNLCIILQWICFRKTIPTLIQTEEKARHLILKYSQEYVKDTARVRFFFLIFAVMDFVNTALRIVFWFILKCFLVSPHISKQAFAWSE